MDNKIALKKSDTNVDGISEKRKQLYDYSEEIKITKELNKSKVSLRKKKNFEYLNGIRKNKLRKEGLFSKDNNNNINLDEIINEIPKEIVSEFSNTKNKYSFFIRYLNITENEDPNFYIRMFVIYQIRNLLNLDNTNSSLPSTELLNSLLQYLTCKYKNNHMNQKIKIQSEIIQMLIIWISYNNEDNTNSPFYEDQFIFLLMDMIDNNLYNIEFKLNILILLNVMIKGIDTFNKIIIKLEIINKIEKILTQIKKDEQYIIVLRLIFNLFKYFCDNDENDEIMYPNGQTNLKENIIFINSYNNFILLLNHYYEEYEKRYKEIKTNKTPISMDSISYIYCKIVILLLKIFNKSIYIEKNIFYINVLINNQLFVPLILKILETFSKEFFLSQTYYNNEEIIMDINNDISLKYNNSIKSKEKNNLYKKFKTINYITHILIEIISSSDKNNLFPNFNKSYEIAMNLIIKFNIFNYYSSLLQNLLCFKIKIDMILILRIEEFIYNFGELNRNNYILLYKNYELIKQLLLINEKYYEEENFHLLIKFIIHSILLYETEITHSLIFEIKIVSIFLKFLNNELLNQNKKLESIKYVLYTLSSIIDSNTYRKCHLNRNLIVYEFNKNNANEILSQYSLIFINSDIYDLVNKILDNLDETDLLDNKELEELYNPSDY